jgi:serine/threonine-protein kinase
VAAGKLSQIKLEMPRGTISVNAQPWAEVWVDGERIGETPIGNLSVAIGSHSVLFRHPELGEQHHTALVTLKGPARISVDMRKPQ